MDARAVGRDLGVRYVLEGSLRKSEDRVRVGVQLTETGSGAQIWAQRYDRLIEDIFAVQDEITQAILGAVLPEIGAAEAERAIRTRPDELDAWAMYHRALDHLFRYTRKDNWEARRLFALAIEKDTTFAAAHSGLAFACFLAIHDDLTDDTTAALNQGLAAAIQSVKLDPRDAHAHTALGRIQTMNRDFSLAIAACAEAIEINPSLAAAFFGRGYALTMVGRPEEAIADLDQAINLSPRDPNVWSFQVVAAWAHASRADYEAALDRAAESAAHPNGNFWTAAAVAVSSAKLGRDDDARDAMRRAMAKKPDLSFAYIEKTLPFDTAAVRDQVFGGLRGLGLPERWDEPGDTSLVEGPTGALGQRVGLIDGIQRLRIAVLPFVNNGRNPDIGDFCDGLTETLNADLSADHRLSVATLGAGTAFTGPAVDPVEAAATLKVRYILMGNARGLGARMRVSVQMLDAETGDYSWVERYDQDTEDLFQLLDDLSARIRSKIDVAILSGEVI